MMLENEPASELSFVNPVEYLTALLENKDQVVKEPQNWLPWCYAKANSNPHQQALDGNTLAWQEVSNYPAPEIYCIHSE